MQIVKLHDGELSLVRFIWSQGPVEGGEFGRRWGAGQSKEDISPACSGLTLLTLTAWLTLTYALVFKDFHWCAALGGLLPSHPCIVSMSPFMLCFFFSIFPSTLFASEARRFESVWKRNGGFPDKTPSSQPHPHTLKKRKKFKKKFKKWRCIHVVLGKKYYWSEKGPAPQKVFHLLMPLAIGIRKDSSGKATSYTFLLPCKPKLICSPCR